MALRSFSRLLTRHAARSSPRRPQCWLLALALAGQHTLHTIRGVGAGYSAYGAAAVVAAALTGGAGILIFKKQRPDDAVDGDVTMEVGIKKEEEVGIKKDMGKHQMEAKFHEWMEKVGIEYPNEEEKAYRFELFKKRLNKETETSTKEGRGKNSFPAFADMTDDEIRAITNFHKPPSKEYEASMMQMKKKMDDRILLIRKEKAKTNAVNCSKQ